MPLLDVPEKVVGNVDLLRTAALLDALQEDGDVTTNIHWKTKYFYAFPGDD